MWIHTGSLDLRRIAVALAGLSCLAMSACGGNSGDDQGGDAVAVEPPKVLSDNAAGKPCAADADCGNGSCAKQLMLGGLGAGTQPAPGGYCTFNCQLDADCGAGGVCIRTNTNGGFGFGNAGGNTSSTTGKCMLRCDSSSQCRDGYRCLDGFGQVQESNSATPAANASGACQVAPATDQLAPGVVGTMCTADGDCGGGQCLTDAQGASFPGGYCTGRCLTNSDCGDGAECVAGFGGAAGACYKNCQADTDCREGYRCRANGLAQTSTRLCYPGAPPLADGIVGSACSADTDCGGVAMSCVMMNGNRALPGGYCTSSCLEDVDCGGGGSCLGGYCYKNCSAAGDCRDGYSCEMLGLGGMAGMGGMGSMVCALPQTMGDQDAGMP